MQDWTPFIIHPQSGTICQDRVFTPWPEDGWLSPDPWDSKTTAIWPVPNLKGARLVECHCGRTGIQPKTFADASHYIPGTRVDGNRLVFGPLLNPFMTYPDGSGTDEDGA